MRRCTRRSNGSRCACTNERAARRGAAGTRCPRRAPERSRWRRKASCATKCTNCAKHWPRATNGSRTRAAARQPSSGSPRNRASARAMRARLDELMAMVKTLRAEASAIEQAVQASADDPAERAADPLSILPGYASRVCRRASRLESRDQADRQAAGGVALHDGGIEDRKGLLAVALPGADGRVPGRLYRPRFDEPAQAHLRTPPHRVLPAAHGERRQFRRADRAARCAGARRDGTDAATGDASRLCLRHWSSDSLRRMGGPSGCP